MPRLNEAEFRLLVARIRAGEQSAAAELVRIYEPQIRREVRLRLTSPHLRRTLDSLDICQSVFGKFFVKAALGELEFDRPEQLLRLLSQMAKNRVIDHHRRESVRPTGKASALQDDVQAVQVQSPSQLIEHQDLMQKMSQLMSESERQIAALRRNGESWASIASQVGGTAESVRKILSRASQRIMDELEIPA